MTDPALSTAHDDCPSLLAEVVALLYRNAGKDEYAALQSRSSALPSDSAGKLLLDESVRMALTIGERLDQYQQRERGLNAVIETAQDLTAIRDIDHVLQAIVHRARKLLGSDIGYLSIYDREAGDFYVRATDGAFSDKFKQVRVARDIGVCGYVARNRTPYSSQDYARDGRFAHSKQIDTAVNDEGIRSILGVPLLSGIDVIGVLFVGERYARAYPAWEMSILSTLAAHASVALENARLFEQIQTALKQVSEANALLKKQTADTQIAAEAHERLTSLVARGGGIKEVCEMVAGMLGGRVAVVDEGEQQLCASSDTADVPPRELHYLRQDKLHAALMESRVLGRSVTAYVTPESVCRVAAVVGSRGFLGGLVIHTATELSELSIRIFERSSMVTGVVLLSQERHDAAAKEEIPAIFFGLLSQPQHDIGKWTTLAARYGLDLSKPVYLGLVRTAADEHDYALKKLTAGFADRAILFAKISDTLVFLSDAAVAVEEWRTALSEFLAREVRSASTGVISKVLPHTAELPSAYQSLLGCLDTVTALGRAGAIFLEQELALYAVLFGKRDMQDLDAFFAATLGKLYTESRQRKTELSKTLLSYLDHGHNASAAAKELGIHINTFRQRLDAIDALLGDWTARALDIHVALRLWQLRQNVDADQAAPALRGINT